MFPDPGLGGFGTAIDVSDDDVGTHPRFAPSTIITYCRSWRPPAQRFVAFGNLNKPVPEL
jgi:hypothetical protein